MARLVSLINRWCMYAKPRSLFSKPPQPPWSVFVCSLSTQPLKTTGKNLGKEMSPESAEV